MTDDEANGSLNVWSIVMFRSKRSDVEEIAPSTRILVIGAGYADLLFTMRLAGKVAGQHVQIALVNEPELHRAPAHASVCHQSGGSVALAATDAAPNECAVYPGTGHESRPRTA